MVRSKTVDSWMTGLEPSIRQIAEGVRNIILRVGPGLKESIKWGNPVYSQKGNIMYIAAVGTYVNLGFFHGARLTDPEGRIDGTGKSMRHLQDQGARRHR